MTEEANVVEGEVVAEEVTTEPVTEETSTQPVEVSMDVSTGEEVPTTDLPVEAVEVDVPETSPVDPEEDKESLIREGANARENPIE